MVQMYIYTIYVLSIVTDLMYIHQSNTNQQISCIFINVLQYSLWFYRKVNVASIAREAFVTLGKVLQERRLKDYETDMGCHLTDSIR
jgi:hypothetical protein